MTELSCSDALFGKQKELPPVIGDRSYIEQYATCPHQAYLCRKHNIPIQNKLVDSGIIIHDLVEEAVEYCRESQDWDMLADYFANELPKVRPDVQPDVIRAARFVTDELVNMPIQRLIGCELQIDHQFLPATSEHGPIVLTTAEDMLFTGRDSSLIVYDWKTGFKKRSGAEALDAFQTCFICWLLWQQAEYQNVEVIHFFYKETRWGSVAYARLERNKEWPQLPHLTTEMQFQGRIAEAVKLWLSGRQDAWPEEKKCLWCNAIWHCKHANTTAKNIKTQPKRAADHYIVLLNLCQKYKEGFTELIKSGSVTEIEGTAGVIKRKKPAEPKFSLVITKSETEPKPKKETKPKKRKGKTDGKKPKKASQSKKSKRQTT